MSWGIYAYGHFIILTPLILFALTNLKGNCKDENNVEGRCVAGAIRNYTTQCLTYNSDSQHNLTEALLFLSHFVGDIHQTEEAKRLTFHWCTRKQNLHHVWDSNIIETAEERFYHSDVEELIEAIQQNITAEWEDRVKGLETCSLNETVSPDIYASEGIKAACAWAYTGVSEGSVLKVNMRLAQGGVRLAAILNRIFG